MLMWKPQLFRKVAVVREHGCFKPALVTLLARNLPFLAGLCSESKCKDLKEAVP